MKKRTRILAAVLAFSMMAMPVSAKEAAVIGDAASWKGQTEEGIQAAKLGFDLVGTTMHGYTPYTKGVTLPDYDMIHRLATELDVPVIAEGGIWVPEQLKEALAQGAFAAVVGTAITRPRDITKRFVEAIR